MALSMKQMNDITDMTADVGAMMIMSNPEVRSMDDAIGMIAKATVASAHATGMFKTAEETEELRHIVRLVAKTTECILNVLATRK